MKLNTFTPNKSLNKSYLKEKVNRTEIDNFKENLQILLNKINENESEEHHKYPVSDFLKNTWYKNNYEINTKGKSDFVIHTGKTTKDSVGVLIEAKKPNSKELINENRINVKSLHELILYYFNEKEVYKNNEIKNLIATDTYKWVIIDVNEFDKKIYNNSQIKKLYKLYKNDAKDNPFFYQEVAKIINQLDDEINATYFDLRDYVDIASNNTNSDDHKLIALFKILSPTHLLKLPFANDNNSLDTKFYAELLHILGLEEIKEGTKKLIKRKRQPEIASILENTIIKLEDKDVIRHLINPVEYGVTQDDQIFNIALELTITWINRILFIKLLEAQLLKYHKNNLDYLILNKKKISDFDQLSNLFFQVLAEAPLDRREHLRELFKYVPYLNSSLFDRTDLELSTIGISELDNQLELNLYEKSILKNSDFNHKSKLPTLQYLFEFLDSYDFSSEGSEEIQEKSKNLINASVLGLIFEKINGYKDGSFYTPGRITMFICKETIESSIIQKFNESKNWGIKTIEELYDKIENKIEANDIINDLKICDPAVGSGHFLVSALNEIISIKSRLRILLDRSGKTLRDYNVEVVNDELIITDDDGNLFEYNFKNPESRRIQEAIFHEKETIIENCLFGVDINQNSVKICRLRLWIELLKHTYYSSKSEYTELETLPNIDINIKCGNSLISRFSVNDDVFDKIPNFIKRLKDYKYWVSEYKKTKTKKDKLHLTQNINLFVNEFKKRDPRLIEEEKKLQKKSTELNQKFYSDILFNTELNDAQKKLKEKLENDIVQHKNKISELNSNRTYKNAFEWRFEFPEVLNENGVYKGFDIVIGNPPYGTLILDDDKIYFKTNYLSSQGPFEVYKYFIERSEQLLKENGFLGFITPDTWTTLSYFKKIRTLIKENFSIQLCSETLYNVFTEARVDTNLYVFKKTKGVSGDSFILLDSKLNQVGLGSIIIEKDDINISLKIKTKLIKRIEENSFPISEIIEVWRGMTAYGSSSLDRPFNSNQKATIFHRPMLTGGEIGKYTINWNGEYIKYGEWLHRPRPSYIYDNPHILVQRIRNPKLKDRIIATLDENKFISSDGLSNILLKGSNDIRDLKCILAILNSKLINNWFSFYYFDVNIKPEQLRKIPMKRLNDTVKNALSTLVNYIVFINTISAEIKINDYVPNKHIVELLEDIIDAIVFELYFSEEFEKLNISIVNNIENYFTSIEDLSDVEKINKIHESYQSIRDKDNIIRNNLKLMDIRLSELIMPIKF